MNNEFSDETLGSPRLPESSAHLDGGAAKLLRWLLFITGCGLLTATLAIFLPAKMMASAHEWLGLGDFPEVPIVLYLARSTSLLYAVHGSLMVYVSLDMNRYWPLVKLFGWLHIAIGLSMLGIDISSSMPTYWIAIEGIPIAIAGCVIVGLWKKVESNSDN